MMPHGTISLSLNLTLHYMILFDPDFAFDVSILICDV